MNSSGDLSAGRSVSVVIPYAGHFDLLTVQLLALMRQDYSGQAEVVVSCNREVISARQIAAICPFSRDIRITVADATTKRGPSYARNVGWRAAEGDLVLFCDSDDEVHENWLREMVGALQGNDIVGGALRYDKFNPPHMTKWTYHTIHHLPRKFHHLPFAVGCSLGTSRQLLKEVSGWDESLTAGEDIDLSWRVQYFGASMGFAPLACVEYRLRRTHIELWRQAFQYGASDAALLERHRRYGAKRSLRDSTMDLCSALYSLGAFATTEHGTLKTATRIGNLAGRIYGSVRSGVFAV